MKVQKALIKKDDKILVLLRSEDESTFPLHWDFPGGKREEGETAFSAVEREVMEETSLKVRPSQVLARYPLVINGRDYEFFIVSADIISGRIKLSSEHKSHRWVTKDELRVLKREPFIDLFFRQFPES